MKKKKASAKGAWLARDLAREGDPEASLVVDAPDWWTAREVAARTWSVETGECIEPWQARILVGRR